MSNSAKIPFPSPSEKIVYSFAVGLLFWIVVIVAATFLGPLIKLPESGSDSMSYILSVALIGSGFLGIHFAVRGCDYGRQYKFGTYGHFLKFFAIVFSAFLIVPQIFWTGRGLLRLILGEVRITG